MPIKSDSGNGEKITKYKVSNVVFPLSQQTYYPVFISTIKAMAFSKIKV